VEALKPTATWALGVGIGSKAEQRLEKQQTEQRVTSQAEQRLPGKQSKQSNGYPPSRATAARREQRLEGNG